MESEHNEKHADATSAEWLENLNRAILESALDCIITMDARGVVLEFNPAAERVFGYTREQAVGHELADLIIPPALRERHRQGLAHYLKTGEGPVLGRRIEIPSVRADGVEILVELAITAFRIQNEPVFAAYLRDITERVRNEHRRTAQYTVASILAGSLSLEEAGPQIIQAIATSGDWIFGSIWLNDEASESERCAVTWHGEADALKTFDEETRRITLLAPHGLPGRIIASRAPTWIRDVQVDGNFARGEAARAANLRGAFGFPLCAAGEINGVLELFSSSLAEPDDDLLQLAESLGSQIGLFIHRRKIERELQRQKEAAEGANAAKDRFLANLSHELRTPLTPVLIWAGGMIGSPDLPGEIEDGLQMICRNVELEARLIDDLLDLTRIARGKVELRPRPVDAHELLRHAVEIVQNEIEERKLILEMRLDAGIHTALADPSRLQQAFWNVLRNATKFTPPRGTITVRTSNPSSAQLTIEIADTGIGIEPQFLGKIFDAFEQVEVRREGLGLGLAISKAVVELHGGTMEAFSAGTGKGASFVLTLATNAAA